MSGCPGKCNGHTCMSTLYKCKKCGNVGCDQGQYGKCSNQAFQFGICSKCGANGQREMLH